MGRSRSRSADRQRDVSRSRSRDRERRRSRSRSPQGRKRSPSPADRNRSRSRSRDRRDRSRSPRDRRRSSPDKRGRSRSPPPRARSPARVGLQIFIAGLSFMFNERDVEKKFERYGRVKEVRIVRNPQNGDSRGFGFVVMTREDDAAEAVRDLNGRDWNGRRLLVEIARNPR